MEKSLSKYEIKKLIDAAVNAESKKLQKSALDKSDIEDIIRGFMKNYHRTLWQRSSSFINQVKS